MVHNHPMRNPVHTLIFALWLTTAGTPLAVAQDNLPEDATDRSSQQVEESDEAYRRRMELEDARTRDPGYTVPSGSVSRDLEKIDKLPEKSRDNIREQLIDVIVENGEWEPFDALREYPYEPTAAAQAEPQLLKEEQEAWDEQIQKYHAREAAAFGASRGPVPGPGSPGGAQAGEPGGEQGAGAEGGGQDAGQDGDQGEQGSSDQGGEPKSAGTYEPYQSNRNSSEEGVSTAGSQQSALDFLRGQQGQPSVAPPADVVAAPPADQPTPQSEPASAPESAAAPEPDAEPDPESGAQSTGDTRGILAIEDLDKLEGVAAQAESEDSDQP